MAIACNLLQERSLVESELKLLHASQRLRYIHSNDLVHMDLKSENISFPKISSTRKSPMPPSCSREPDPYSMDDSTLLLLVLGTAQICKQRVEAGMIKLQYYQQDRFYYYELIIVQQQLNYFNYAQFESCGSSCYWEHDIRNCHPYKRT
ncbi:hypothetical protein GQX74_013915 [Glossina fuscipes]|nr:hypothetical protein GQX74_013915 [Glossina fuscipes]